MSPKRILKRENTALLGAACVSLLAFAAIFIAVVLRVQDQNRIDDLASSTHDALCTFKANIQDRLTASQQFLDQIRDGKRQPIPGISNADLQRSIDARQETLRSLSTLDCKEEAS